jgi:hypothetical protein
MSKFLLTVCAFGLLFSSALAQEKSLDELDREQNRIWGAEGLQRVSLDRPPETLASRQLAFYRLEIKFVHIQDRTADRPIIVRRDVEVMFLPCFGYALKKSGASRPTAHSSWPEMTPKPRTASETGCECTTPAPSIPRRRPSRT